VDLARVAAQAEMDLSVVSMMPLGDHRYAGMLRAAGVDVRSLDLAGWWDPRGPRRLTGLIDRLAPDVLHSHLKHADVVAGRVAGKIGVPHVSTLHVIEDRVGGLAARKRDWAAHRRMRSAALTIAVSDALRSWYLATFPEIPAASSPPSVRRSEPRSECQRMPWWRPRWRCSVPGRVTTC